MQRRTNTQLGFQHLLQTPASPMTKTGLEAFREMKKSCGMDTPDILNYMGKKLRMPSQVKQDEAQQKKRIEMLSDA